jgi:hypothetical protein
VNAIPRLMVSKKIQKILCLLFLFIIIFGAFLIHHKTFKPGYLNAGDDHIHVAFSNELKKIWSEEGRVLGWSKLYGTGAPIFMMRPPGFYIVTNVISFFTGLTIEESLKVAVALGFCLFPLSIFICGRLLGLGFGASFFAGVIAPLPISLWGHTIDAYQYLGIYKQLFAILTFPVAVGSLWRLMKNGDCGLLFAVSFPFMFITHPYIAYSFVLIVPFMIIALMSQEIDWDWLKGISECMMWSIPAFFFLCFWLIPFMFSPETQVIDPYMGLRNAFDVVTCTTAETLRQFFLGGLFDTTRFAGPFGGITWVKGNEFGWLSNSSWVRFPIISLFSFIGLLIVILKSKSSVHGFLSLCFFFAMVLFIGPDDFPVLDIIPFAKKFQNIHAIFMLEWVAIMLSGIACYWLFQKSTRFTNNYTKYMAITIFVLFFVFSYGSAIYERTRTGMTLIDIRNINTQNGELSVKPDMFVQWRHFIPVVEKLKESREMGNIAAFPLSHDDSVMYNLLPLMVDRQVSISGFEMVGGVYHLLLNKFRTNVRDNYNLQQLFNIRYIINSPFHRKIKMDWHKNIDPIFEDKYWELVRVKGKFGEIDSLPLSFVGFVGSERSWQQMMEQWLKKFEDGDPNLPWIINFTHSSLQNSDIHKIKPFIKLTIQSDDFPIHKLLKDIRIVKSSALLSNPINQLKNELGIKNNSQNDKSINLQPFNYEVLEKSRKSESYRVNSETNSHPLLFKRTYYRGWRATINGKKTPVYRISPGFQMIIIPHGNHVLKWYYTGPNLWWLGSGLFWLACVIIIVFTWRQKRRAVFPDNTITIDHEKKEATSLRKKRIHYIPSGICGFFILIFAYQTMMEGYFKVPVTILPYSGQVIEGSACDFSWNYVVGIPKNEQKFHLQIAEDSEFMRIIESKTVTGNHTRINDIFKHPGPYYYRIRLTTGDGTINKQLPGTTTTSKSRKKDDTEFKTYKWTKSIKLYGKKNE